MTLFYPGSRSDISFRFYDLQGRVVGVRKAERKAPGQYELTWDGRNQQGYALPSGLYFLKPEVTSALFRIVLLR
jgi:flagellar hook assembly protein FlgD